MAGDKIARPTSAELPGESAWPTFLMRARVSSAARSERSTAEMRRCKLKGLLLVQEGGRQRIFLGLLTPLEQVGGMFGTGPIPDLSLGFAQTAQKPIGGYSVIDEGDLFGALRLKAVVILGW